MITAWLTYTQCLEQDDVGYKKRFCWTRTLYGRCVDTEKQ